jgi:uncharacterized protein (DUF2252 family)
MNSRKEKLALGKSIREKCPRTSHASFKVSSDRPDPWEILKRSDAGRMEELIPLRHGRMLQSSFTYYRAGALNMTIDLAATVNTGINVQCCGDAHLSNFGGYATPERNIIFSINDLDETLSAPWEWDIKRLATSFVIASRSNNFSDDNAHEVVLECVKSYRERMAEFSLMNPLDLWYFSITSDMVLAMVDDSDRRKRGLKNLEKAKENNLSKNVFPKLDELTNGKLVIKDEPPTIFHTKDQEPGVIDPYVRCVFTNYLQTLATSHQLMLKQYELKDLAIKVVGVGSVGTKCWILLFVTGDGDPLFLQVKEANQSVLEDYAGKSKYDNHGHRIVTGYRIMQPVSDIFLGWTYGEKGNHHYYVRQLRDVKFKFPIEKYDKTDMVFYAKLCGYGLALAHARSGKSSLLSGYMGKSDAFDEAVASFSFSYADQNEKDYEEFKRGVKKGLVNVEYEE